LRNVPAITTCSDFPYHMQNCGRSFEIRSSDRESIARGSRKWRKIAVGMNSLGQNAAVGIKQCK